MKWIIIHSVVSAIFGLVLISLFFFSTGPAMKIGALHLALALLFLPVAIGILYVVSLYLLAYSARKEAEQEQLRIQQENLRASNPNKRIFQGFLWCVKLDGDDIEVVTKFFYVARYHGKLSEVKRLEVSRTNRKRYIWLVLHDYKWRRPNEEIPVGISGVGLPVAMEMMRTIKEKAINAKVSPEYIETMETGKGIW